MSSSVTVTQVIDADAQKIWQAISEPGVLERTHPFVEKNPVEQWPGIGAKDTIHYFSGLTLHRDFTYWNEEQGYDLKIRQGSDRGTTGCGSTSSTSNAALSAIRRAPQLGQKPRRLHENATSFSSWQEEQRTRRKPCSNLPHLRYSSNSFATK